MPNHLFAAELASSGKLPPGLLFALVPLLVLVVARFRPMTEPEDPEIVSTIEANLPG
jgi:hypothetical protein